MLQTNYRILGTLKTKNYINSHAWLHVVDEFRAIPWFNSCEITRQRYITFWFIRNDNVVFNRKTKYPVKMETEQICTR